MKRITLLVACLMIGFLLCGTAFAAEAAWEVMTDIPYLDDGEKDHLLDVYGITEGMEKTPVIIEIHGGGFIGGTKKTNTAHSGVYADAGFLVVTPNYTHLPKGDFRTVLQDVFSVLHWVEANAEEYHFDTDRIFLSGDSAGACIVSLTASCLTNEEVRSWYGVELPGFEVSGYILTCPTVDILSIRDDLGAEGYPGHKAKTIGEDILFNDELMNMAHVFNLLDENYPEVYIITTPTDALFNRMSVAFEAALTEKNIPHEYHVYEGTENELGHVFNVEHVEYAESIQANAEAIAYIRGICG